MNRIIIDGKSLKLENYIAVVRNYQTVELSKQTDQRVKESREYVEELIQKKKKSS